MTLRTITESYVDELIDFEPTESIKRAGIGKLQKSGAVALFNMLVRNGVGYLADEVGMGKTYIGLAVMSLLRYQKPDARILILTPRRNIQEKWAADLASFVQMNWRYADHRVKTPQGNPDWPALLPDRLSDWIRDVHTCEPHDTIMRMSSFSLGINSETAAHEMDRFSRNQVPSHIQKKIRAATIAAPDQVTFARAVRDALSGVNYDLVIVDEAHNLKHGYIEGQPSSLRNETLHHIFAPTSDSGHCPRLLMLSATPMENGDPATLVRQFECFARNTDTLRDAEGVDDGTTLSSLAGPLNASAIRELQRRLIVRRVGELRLQDNSRYTRNMYRKEWRHGGVRHPDEPMTSASTAERLVNAVIQKNVFDLLQRTSGGRFRIGALESFEIYSGAASTVTENDESAQQGQILPDQRLIADLCESYRNTFQQEVPHPKLNAVAQMLSEQLAQREKALVFVRRVATTTDLASRVSAAYDDEIVARISAVVAPEQSELVERLDGDWRSKRARREFEESLEADDEPETDQQHDLSDEVEDSRIRETVPSLFTWFFRGEHRGLQGYGDWITGRRVRELLESRNRFCLLLEENYVDWVLCRPNDVLTDLAQSTGISKTELIVTISRRVPTALYHPDNYRRGYHAVQYATLCWMAEQSCFVELVPKLRILVDEIFGRSLEQNDEYISVQPRIIQEYLSLRSLYPALARCPRGSICSSIIARGVFEDIDQRADLDFRTILRRREQIRHLQMASLRHGAPTVDLYCAFIETRGGNLLVDQDVALPVDDVASTLTGMWAQLARDQWRKSSGWELSELNQNFDLIRKLNLPSLESAMDRSRPLDSVFIEGREPASDSSEAIRSARRLLNQEMSGQAPAVPAMGGHDDQRRHRITTQFRMPGMPWVVVATNVYEEGVDLHTYCKTVVHHGVSHTASSVEQRTGRVDRIGGLLQRQVATIDTAEQFSDPLKIQSLFPYQNDTFEKFQVRRVLTNCNRFIQSLHDGASSRSESKDMDISERYDVPSQITDRLKSPFDVQESPWIQGENTVPDRSTEFDLTAYNSEFDRFEACLKSEFPDVKEPGAQGVERHYWLGETKIVVTPHSHREGDWLVMEVCLVDVEHGEFELASIDADASGNVWSEKVFRQLKVSLKRHGITA